ncbi:MAG TPA: hypothetical protein VLJ76_02935 [Gaiellaceae bacterium]|nr:hypothetical protein [Gaiellaceae bacterium]
MKRFVTSGASMRSRSALTAAGWAIFLPVGALAIVAINVGGRALTDVALACLFFLTLFTTLGALARRTRLGTTRLLGRIVFRFFRPG